MSGWVESDRVKLRRWLGATALFSQADPMIESALDAVQSLADGGSRPDASTETAIRAYLTKLDSIESALDGTIPIASVLGANDGKLDPVRGAALIKQRGRQFIGHICDALGLAGPRRDVFSPIEPNPSGSPFYPGAGRP